MGNIQTKIELNGYINIGTIQTQIEYLCLWYGFKTFFVLSFFTINEKR